MNANIARKYNRKIDKVEELLWKKTSPIWITNIREDIKEQDVNM